MDQTMFKTNMYLTHLKKFYQTTMDQNIHIYPLIKSKIQIIKDIIFGFNLIDIWTFFNLTLKRFTWHSNTKPTIFSRLDYFLTSEYPKNIVTSCKIKLGYKSDHSNVPRTK